MAEKIEVTQKPTPIQRNAHDVAMELLNIHLQNVAIDYSVEGLQMLYTKFYSCIVTLENTQLKILKEFVPKELKEIK